MYYPLSGRSVLVPAVRASVPIARGAWLLLIMALLIAVIGGWGNFPPPSASPAITIVDVRRFGAVGDGVNDDTQAISDAQDSLPPEGGIVYFPRGVYAVRSGVLTVQKPNVVFRGAGMDVTTIRQTTGSGPTFGIPEGQLSGIVFENLGFDRIQSGESRNYITAASNADTRTLRVSRCRFWSPTLPAIRLVNAANVLIEDSLFHSPGDATGIGIQLDYNAQDITIRRNRFLWLRDSIIINTDDERIFTATRIIIRDNYFDGGWWLIKERFTGEGDSVTYTEKTLTDTRAQFRDLATFLTDVGHNVRVMPIRQRGTAIYDRQTLVDRNAKFRSSGLLPGEIIRAGDAFAVVAAVRSETTLTVEAWLNESDRLPRNPPPRNTPYTAYGVILGVVWDGDRNPRPYTETSITTLSWWDLRGNRVTPPDGTRYEVLVRRPNYTGIHAEEGFQNSLIENNRVRRGWSDQISIYGGPNVRITRNVIEEGQDMGITLNGSGNIAENNVIRRQGVGGIWVSGFYPSGSDPSADSQHIIRYNRITDSQWVNPAAGLGDIIVVGSGAQIIYNRCEFTGRALGYNGIVVRGSRDNYLAYNLCGNHVHADILITGASGTMLCSNRGLVVEENSTGTVRRCR